MIQVLSAGHCFRNFVKPEYMNENGDYFVDILNSSIPISPEDWYKWKSYYVMIDEDIQGRNVFQLFEL